MLCHTCSIFVDYVDFSNLLWDVKNSIVVTVKKFLYLVVHKKWNSVTKQNQRKIVWLIDGHSDPFPRQINPVKCRLDLLPTPRAMYLPSCLPILHQGGCQHNRLYLWYQGILRSYIDLHLSKTVQSRVFSYVGITIEKAFYHDYILKVKVLTRELFNHQLTSSLVF